MSHHFYGSVERLDVGRGIVANFIGVKAAPAPAAGLRADEAMYKARVEATTRSFFTRTSAAHYRTLEDLPQIHARRVECSPRSPTVARRRGGSDREVARIDALIDFFHVSGVDAPANSLARALYAQARYFPSMSAGSRHTPSVRAPARRVSPSRPSVLLRDHRRDDLTENLAGSYAFPLEALQRCVAARA